MHKRAGTLLGVNMLVLQHSDLHDIRIDSILCNLEAVSATNFLAFTVLNAAAALALLSCRSTYIYDKLLTSADD